NFTLQIVNDTIVTMFGEMKLKINIKAILRRNLFPLLPFMASTTRLFFFITSYIVAAFHNAEIEAIPYPVNLTKSEPESGLYQLGLLLSTMLTFCVVIMRYIQINNIYPRNLKGFNIMALIMAIIVLMSSMVSAAYPLTSSYGAACYPAICISYLFTVFYMTFQSYISFHTDAFYNGSVCYIRIGCTILSLCVPIISVFSRVGLTNTSPAYHQLTAACEWVFNLLIVVYFYSFCYDFNLTKIRSYVVDDMIRKSADSFRAGNNYVDYLRSHHTTSRTRRHLSDSGSHMGYHINTEF
uniref:CWH43-like N-terminal domain-containing protein n=1 Tax=Clytia hemisphaerica TaxID=252671 RepID=A0A7M5XL27_9CNID